MVKKKYLLLAGLCSVLAFQPVQAQEDKSAASWSGRDMTYRGDNYDVMDSSYYPKNRLDQYRKYVNHQTAFPPKPSNMWEVGVHVGILSVMGDCAEKTPFTAFKPLDAMGFDISVRKAFGYSLSGRIQYMHGVASGFEYRSRTTTNLRHTQGQNPDVRALYAAQFPGSTGGYGKYYHVYRTKIDEISVQIMANTNNIRFHKGKNAFSLYGYLGAGAMIFDPRVNALDANGDAYITKDVPGFGDDDEQATWKTRKETNNYIKDTWDDTYETVGYTDSHSGKGNKNNIPVFITGLGFQFKVAERVSIQVEDKVTWTFRDGLDAIVVTNTGELSPDKDVVNYGSLGVNFNIGNKRKNVLPLWWVNPLDHAYNELSDPRHMKLPDPVLPDADGDGITNQFDKCPGTPAGVAVDSHGCPLDTDGDGVPDYKDKQLITPTECQPVDRDGVGKCPCPGPECGTTTASPCSNIFAGSLSFGGTTSRITPAMQSQLATLAAQMSANPTCKVVIIGAGNKSKPQQQRSWERVNAVIEYLSEKNGIDRGRFIFQYGQPGDENSVMYRSANQGEEGPSNVRPPHPNLSGTK